MAGTAHQSPVTAPPTRPSSIVFERACPDDDADIRCLFRDLPMGGQISISLECEPNARLALGVEGDRHYTIVAREQTTRRVVGMGSRAVWRVWVNGEPAKLGYLAQLRRVPGLRASRRLLAAGFAELDRTRLPDELRYDLTCIVAHNSAARRLLERGLKGLPRYAPLCEFTTLIIPVGRRPRRRPARVERGSDDLIPAIADCLYRNLRQYQFAPIWSEEDLNSPVRTRGLRPDDFFVVMEGNRVIACLARWDQRGFKQAVVRGYPPRLARWRPAVNIALTLAGRPRLPDPGQALNFAYLSHVAVEGDRHDLLVDLIEAARADTTGTGIDYLLIGLASTNPMLPPIRRVFPGRAYPSILYVVHRELSEDSLRNLGGRITHVELATL